MHLYPDNTLQNYKTEVSLTGEFVGQWEVGMASLTYPGMWYNVSEVDTACYVFMNDASIRECKLPTGRYLRMEGLLMALNKTLNSTIPGGLDFFDLTYDDLTRKVTYKMGKRNDTAEMVDHPKVLGSTFSKNVTSILGFEDFWDRDIYPDHLHAQNMLNPLALSDQYFTGTYVADLNRGIHSLYVYSDIVEPCPVGDTRAPLLRIVPIGNMVTQKNTSSLSQMTQSFSRIHYHPLAHRRVATIEIDIKDSRGRPVPFERGEVVVTLHVRKVKRLL